MIEVLRRQTGLGTKGPSTVLLAAGLAALGQILPPAAAQELPGDPVAGRELARSVCAACHAVEPQETKSLGLDGPSFAEVAADPATTPLGLRVFLRSPHRNMPNLMLSETETDNIIAYIIGLK